MTIYTPPGAGFPPTILTGVTTNAGNLSSAYTVNFTSAANTVEYVTGTLNANCTITFSNRAAGCQAYLFLSQDGTGGRTLSISDGTSSSVVSVPSAANAFFVVEVFCPDATNVDVLPVLGGPLPNSVVGASRFLLPSGSDDSVAAAAAIAAGGTIVLGPGTFLWNTSVPAFSRNTPTRVVGAGVGKTTIKLSSGAIRAFDCPRIADYDLFRDIEISDFTVDASALSAPAVNQHLVIGNLIAGDWAVRANSARIACRRIRVIGAPVQQTAGLGAYQAFSFGSKHLSANEATQTSITDITYEDLDVTGCNYGFVVLSNAPTNSANCLIDNIHWNRLTCDSGVVPSLAVANGAGGHQIGGAGFGGTWRVSNCKFTNLLDTFELDSPSDCICTNVIVTDARNQAFLAWRFNTLQPARTSHTFQNCTAKVVNVQPVSACRDFGWVVGGSGCQPLGDVRIKGCSRIGTSPVLGGSIAIQAAFSDFATLTIDDFMIAHEVLNDTITATGGITLINVFPLSTRAIVTVHNVRIVLVGSLTNPSVVQGIDISGTGGAGKDTLIDVDNITFDNRLTGTGGIYGCFIGGSGAVANSTVHGRIAGVRAPAGWTGVAPTAFVGVAATSANTITNLVIENCDGTAAGGTLVSVDATQAAKVITRDNAGFNPVGVVTVTVPATGVAVAAQPYDRTFYVTTAALGCTMTIQNGPAVVIPASSFGTVRVPATKTVTPTFTNPPTWLVEGE